MIAPINLTTGIGGSPMLSVENLSDLVGLLGPFVLVILGIYVALVCLMLSLVTDFKKD